MMRYLRSWLWIVALALAGTATASDWSIGIYSGSSPFQLSSPNNVVNPVLTPKSVTDVQAQFVADPFIVKEGSTWYLFCEVLNAQTGRGEIGLATSPDGIHWTYQQIVLQEPWHISYPYVFKYQGEYYMMPESGITNSIRIYKATSFPTQWTLFATPLTGRHFSDSTLAFFNDKWWLFSSPEANDTLWLYYADSPFGPFTEHPMSPVVSGDPNIARSGGRLLVDSGHIYRYAQDDFPTYGNRVHAFEITTLTTTSYAETPVPIDPIVTASGSGWNDEGMHQVDPVPLGDGTWLAAVDGIGDASVINHEGWTLQYVDSQQVGDGNAVDAFDGNTNSFWHTRFTPVIDPLPHEIQINLGRPFDIYGFRHTPRQDGGTNGRIGQYEFYVSSDGVNWGSPVSTGTFPNDATVRDVPTETVSGSYIRLRALTSANGDQFTSLAEIDLKAIPYLGNHPPVGSITSPSGDVTINERDFVTFNGSGTDPDGNTPLSFHWDFGGAGIPSSNLQNPGPLQFNSAGDYTVSLTVTDALGAVDPTPFTRVVHVLATAGGDPIPKNGWTLHYVDSQETAAENGAAINGFDGNTATIWHTGYSNGIAPLPHEIQIDLHAIYSLSGFRYTPRQDGGTNGRVGDYEFYVSADGTNWGSPVVTGTFANSASTKEVHFAPTNGSFIRFRALTEVNGLQFTTMAEIDVLGGSAGISWPAGFDEEVLTSALDKPVAFAFASDGRIFVAEKNGRIRIVSAAGQLLPAPFATLAVDANGDRGLTGIALDPNFATNGYVYVAYTSDTVPASPANGFSRVGRVSRLTASGDVAIPGSEVVLVDGIPSDSYFDTGGALRFGTDGMLYVGTGDGADASAVDPLALRALDLDALPGKILRLNPDGSSPADNPYYTSPESLRSKVWQFGLKNPAKASFRPGTGKLYVNDPGRQYWEEINFGLSGIGFGWPCFEGNGAESDFAAAFPAACAAASNTPPVDVYARTASGGQITGGAFYEGSNYPADNDGTYFAADYEQQWIKRIDFSPADQLVQVRDFASDGGRFRPTDLAMGPDGNLYYLNLGSDLSRVSGELSKVIYVGAGNHAPKPVAQATPSSGYAPLAVSFSAAGTTDADRDLLTYLWDFGDGNQGSGLQVGHVYTSNGSYTVVLSVSDGIATRTESLVVVVGSTAPSVSFSQPPAGQTYAPGETIAYAGGAVDPDEGTLDPSTLRWTVLRHRNNSIYPYQDASGSPGSFIAVGPGFVGEDIWYEIVLSATDASGLTSTQNREIHLNQAPLANAGPDQLVPCLLPPAVVTLDGRGSQDPEGQPLTYAWVQTAGPIVSLSGATTAQPSFTAPIVAGGATLTFQLTVSDGRAQSSDAVNVAVPDLRSLHPDLDGDGYGNGASSLAACAAPAGYVATTGDCDDGNPAVNPGASDTSCDGIDQNCSGTADEGFVGQPTTCGTGPCQGTGVTSCVAGTVQDSCSPSTGACDDGNACTVGDTCATGSCVGAPTVCNDNNPCTDDSCNPATGCVYTNNTAPCSDGNACTTGDVCAGGSCQPGTPTVCNDNNPCTDDSCNPATGCVYTNNTAACSDGNACTTGDVCAGGSCQPGAPTSCDDGNPCTDDSCNPATGCVHANNTATCSDGNACTTGDVCAGGSCQPGTPVVCNDNNACTDDSCNPATGCVYANNTAACSDGNACTTGDVCGGGSCQPGAPTSCDDGNPCTDDSCNPATGCVHVNNTASCDDGNACTFGDVCGGGTCHAGSPVVCNDNNPCTDDACSPATGCVFTNNTAPCDDGNACTTGDVCAGGACAGTLLPTPEIGPSVVLDGQAGSATISWSDGSAPGPFNVYRGYKHAGAAWAYDHYCLGDSVSGTSAQDTLVPPPGTVFYYVVSREGCSGESILGRDSSGTPIPNGDPCPSTGQDADGDGIEQALDNCPGVANPTQSDFDGDGIGDACDHDADNDGYDDSVDCAPLNPNIHPDAADLCNGIDDDCNPATADGANDPAVGIACDGPDTDLCNEGATFCSGGAIACSDTTGNSVEGPSTSATCSDGIDNDCDGLADDADPDCAPPVVEYLDNGSLDRWPNSHNAGSWNERATGACTITQETADVHTVGGSAARLNRADGGDLWMFENLTVSLQAGRWYRLTFWGKANTTSQRLRASVRNVTRGLEVAPDGLTWAPITTYSIDNPATTSYAQQQVVFRVRADFAPTDAYAVYLLGYAVGSVVSFDDVSLQGPYVSQAAASGQSLAVPATSSISSPTQTLTGFKSAAAEPQPATREKRRRMAVRQR